MSFEILAVDEDSGDNSHAVLALLRAEVPDSASPTRRAAAAASMSAPDARRARCS